MTIPVTASDEQEAVQEFVEAIVRRGLRSWVYAVVDEDDDLRLMTGDGEDYVPESDDDDEDHDVTPRTSFGDGTWEVGVDIAPGVYVARPPFNGYWARLGSLSGDAINANNNVAAGSHVVVEIKRSDRAFETTGCGLWVRRAG